MAQREARVSYLLIDTLSISGAWAVCATPLVIVRLAVHSSGIRRPVPQLHARLTTRGPQSALLFGVVLSCVLTIFLRSCSAAVLVSIASAARAASPVLRYVR